MSAGTARAEAAVPIPDAHFLNCLDSNLGKADGETVTATELAGITQLYCDDMEIADLTGAKYLTHVEDLYLAENAITNLGGLQDFAPVNDPLTINLTSNKIADLSALKPFTATTVYADDQTWEVAVDVGTPKTVSIKGRSGASITDLTPAEPWSTLTIEGAKVTASEAGLYDLDFSDPQECLSSADCTDPEYTFNGTVTVVASAEFASTPAPTISGTAEVGQTLTAQVTDWTPLQDDWSYQWFRDDEPIPGADASTYSVATADIGADLRVEVTGIRTGYAGPNMTSPTVTVAAPAFITTAPTISGTAAIGQTLTAEVAGWTPTPDSWEYQWFRGDTEISGATAATYIVTLDDVASTLKVSVTGSKPGYAPATRFSETTDTVPLATFTATSAPTISGTAAIGQTLTAQASGWSPTPDSWEYEWYRGDTEISGAVASTYVVTLDDAGSTLKVEVTGSKPGYAPASATSQPTGEVAPAAFTDTPAPTISGMAALGETLTAVVSDWSPEPDSWEYQWFRGDTKITGATASTYIATRDDVGSTLKVSVTGSKRGYAPASATSAPTGEVAVKAFTATPAPTISGTAAMGETLTAEVSGWTPTPDTWTYQWYRNDTAITGAVGSTYLVVAEDAGSTLKVTVTGAKAGYASASATSVPTGTVPGKAFAKTTRPTITGTAKVGRTLTAKVAGWSPTPDRWTYQWYSNGGVIDGATKSSYVLAGSDYGKRITVTVTGIKVGYSSTSWTSSSTGKVGIGTFTTARPIITGTVQVGHTLTATAPGWTPTADHWYYRWYRDSKPISYATKPDYTLVGSDAGKRISVKMAGVKTGYSTASRTSKETARVLYGQFSAPTPTITGEPKVGNTLTVVSSGWSPVPTHLHRQWYRDGKRIWKATKVSYQLTAADLGHSITASVVGEKTGYVSMKKTTSALLISG